MFVNKKWIIFFLLMSVCIPFSFAQPAPLPAQKAFILSVKVNKPNEIIAHWRIAPGYHLYQNKFYFSFTPAIPFQAKFPKGEPAYDVKRGHYEVFSGT